MASTLRMRTAISPRQWQPWTAIPSGLVTAHQHGITSTVTFMITDTAFTAEAIAKALL